jgi:hypothetical protein
LSPGLPVHLAKLIVDSDRDRGRPAMNDTWEWQIRVRRSGTGEYEDAESQPNHRRPPELHEVIDAVLGGDHLQVMVGNVHLPQEDGSVCQVIVEEIQTTEIEGFSLEGKTKEKIWVARHADSHVVVVFAITEGSMGLTGESQVLPIPTSPLEREVITAPARRAAYEFLRKLHSMRM